MIKPMNILRFTSASTILLTFVILTPLAVSAGVYKWTDANGNVHYGSERPVDTEPERLNIDDGAKYNPYADPVEEQAKREEAKKATAEKKSAKEKLEKEEAANKPPEPPEPTVSKKGQKVLCQQARNEKKLLIENPRVRDAKRNFLSPKQHAERMARANKEIREYCR